MALLRHSDLLGVCPLPEPNRKWCLGMVRAAFVKGFGCRPIVTAPRTPGPASESLQGRKPREVWRGGASDAMGIWTLATCCRGALIACLGSSRRGGEQCRAVATGRTGVAQWIERHDG